jgi:hypothetical protein
VNLPQGDVPTVAGFLLDNHGEAWTRWRCERITSWVAQARQVIERVRPRTTLGLFCVPWCLADFDGAILEIIGQDFCKLGEYIDVFSPMVYHAMCGRPVEWIGAVTEEVHRLGRKPVWPIVQSVDRPRMVSAGEYGRALDVALRCPESGGVLVFTLAGALDADKLAVTQERFAQGWSVEWIPDSL